MQMTRNQIFEKLKNIISTAFGDDSLLEGVDESNTLTEDLGLNSVNILYIVIAIEEVFGIEFDSDSGINAFVTVGDVIDYIEGKLK